MTPTNVEGLDRENKLDDLIALLENAGHTMTECPVLVPAETVLDLVGPLTRGRLYLTQGIGGKEFCLRPEFTIAISDAHIKTGTPGRLAGYGYCGPVFRKRPTGTGEFLQAGAESIGRKDVDAADAEMVVLAWQACRVFGIEPETTFGDQAVFTAVLAALNLPPIWHRRLLAAFGDARHLDKALSDLSVDGNEAYYRFSGLGSLQPEAATAIVEEMITRSDSSMAAGTIAGRNVADIAKRLLSKARLDDQPDRIAEKVAAIRDYLEIDCAVAEAEDQMYRFAVKHKLDLSAEIATFTHRCSIINSIGETLGPVRFQASFGQLLDYYTGFIFDIFDKASDRSGVAGSTGLPGRTI